jgi:hypothetical protein
MEEVTRKRRRMASQSVSNSPSNLERPATPSFSSRATDDEADIRARAAGIVSPADAARMHAMQSLPTLEDGYLAVQERIFTLPDPNAEYDELERAMKLGTREFDSVSRALDDAEDNARRAHKLYVNARLEYERFSIDADIIEAGMAAQARTELEREKETGQRSKQITQEDVKHKCLAMFPDEWRDLAERRVKGRKMLEHLERFAELWKTRCFSLAKQLEARR